jgi:endoglucanase
VTLTEIASTAAPQLHVSGNELVDASGNQVVLHGMDRSGAEYTDPSILNYLCSPTSSPSLRH